MMKLTERAYNFSAGPAMLPEPVLKEAYASFLNWNATGMSMLEVPHRSALFENVLNEAEQGIRQLLSIPDDYHVLFIGGPARLQFSMIPMNFIHDGGFGGYLVSGLWSHKAWRESQRLKATICLGSSEPAAYVNFPDIDTDLLNDNLEYIFYTPNETVNGVQIRSVPDVGNIPLIADMTSFILSEPIDVTQYAMIFAGAQKLIANAGLTITIVQDAFVNRIKHTDLPFLLDYRTHIAERSIAATPPTFNCYLSTLMFKWVKSQGGVEAMQALNQTKSNLLYETIDNSNFYHCAVHPDYRSVLNVCFRLANPDLEALFIEKAAKSGLLSLKGHRLAGGIRASIYNAMPLEGVQALVHFMKQFELENG